MRKGRSLTIALAGDLSMGGTSMRRKFMAPISYKRSTAPNKLLTMGSRATGILSSFRYGLLRLSLLYHSRAVIYPNPHDYVRKNVSEKRNSSYNRRASYRKASRSLSRAPILAVMLRAPRISL